MTKVKTFKKGQIVKHKWKPFDDWICFSKITSVDKDGVGFTNIINISTETETFDLGKNFVDFEANRYHRMEFEIMGEIVSEEDQIKSIIPEYFL